MKTVKSGTAIIAEPKRTAQKGKPMSDWVGIFIILISLFFGGFALGVKWERKTDGSD